MGRKGADPRRDPAFPAHPARDPGRRRKVARIAELFGVSAATVYRSLQALHRPKALRRSDRGQPRAIPAADMTRFARSLPR